MRRKGKKKQGRKLSRMVVRRLLRGSTAERNDDISVELPGMRSTLAVRAITNEVRNNDPILVFLAKTKANLNRIKGLQRKLGLTQGIMVSSDGRSGGLAMVWKEGFEVRFKSCSNTHIDVVVCEGNRTKPWQATGFYRHLDAGIIPIS